MKISKSISAAILAVFAMTLSVTAFADEPVVNVTDIPDITVIETTKNNYNSEILYEDVDLDVSETEERKIVIESEEPEITVPAENTVEYEKPQIEIPDTGSKKPFWTVAVCIIGMGAVVALALI